MKRILKSFLLGIGALIVLYVLILLPLNFLIHDKKVFAFIFGLPIILCIIYGLGNTIREEFFEELKQN